MHFGFHKAWFILILFLFSRICRISSRSMGLSSVKHDTHQRGILITSFSFQKKENLSVLHPPLWVSNYLQTVPTPSTLPVSDPFAPLQCYLEMLGFLDYPRKSHIGIMRGAARLSQRQSLSATVNCNYKNTFVQQALEGDAIPLIYYCPVYEVTVCSAFTLSKERYVEYELITKKQYSTVFQAKLHKDERLPRTRTSNNMFDTTPTTSTSTGDKRLVNNSMFSTGKPSRSRSNNQPSVKDTPSLGLMKRFRNIVNIRRQLRESTTTSSRNLKESLQVTSPPDHLEAAVCLILPYKSVEAIQKGLVIEHIRWYHEVLGFKVIVYDKGGNHHDLIAANRLFDEFNELRIDYHNYTLYDLLKLEVRGRSMILDTDFDKILTLTHCRMEARAMYNIQSVLIVDSDEFLYCTHNTNQNTETSPNMLGNYQRQAIQNLLHSAAKSNTDQLSFTRFSPMYDAFHQKGIARHACMFNALVGKKISLFSCFAPIKQRRGNYLPKSLTVNYMCPRANTHESCIAEPKPDECTCNIHTPDNDQCFVIHVRGVPLLPQKENIRNKTDNPKGLSLELNEIMNILPRPRVPAVPKNSASKLTVAKSMYASITAELSNSKSLDYPQQQGKRNEKQAAGKAMRREAGSDRAKKKTQIMAKMVKKREEERKRGETAVSGREEQGAEQGTSVIVT